MYCARPCDAADASAGDATDWPEVEATDDVRDDGGTDDADVNAVAAAAAAAGKCCC